MKPRKSLPVLNEAHPAPVPNPALKGISSGMENLSQPCPLVIQADQIRLKTNGLVSLAGPTPVVCSVQRGMAVLALDGSPIGSVAAVAVAVAVDVAGELAKFIVLGHLPTSIGYQAVPVDQVLKVDAQSIWLKISSEQAQALPVCRDEG